MKLKSKTIVYELEDGTKLKLDCLMKKHLKEVVQDYRLFEVTNDPQLPFRSAVVWKQPTKPNLLYWVNYMPFKEREFYTDKQEAIQAAKDYLEGKK